MRLIGFYDYTVILTYISVISAVLGMVCAVIRLACFNVQEAKRQQVESGCNKYYRGLPVTSSAIILPAFYLLRSLLPGKVFTLALHGLCGLIAFLFVLDFRVKKPDFSKILCLK